uniref:ORF26 n=1 Tax=Nitrosopumilaceae spindle-shaped virus TaxID=3065433 RepID=A0AAT9J9N8_9VIRU
MGLLSRSNRIEAGRHSKLYYGFIDFGRELWNAKYKIFWYSICIGFLLFLLSHANDITKGIDRITQEQQTIEETNTRIHNMVTTSTDCYVLQQNILMLIADGANAEKWLPNDKDNDLKVGKERYAILGCKN